MRSISLGAIARIKNKLYPNGGVIYAIWHVIVYKTPYQIGLKPNAIIPEEIKIPKLGNFFVNHKNSRPGRNPKTGEPYEISDRNVVSFRASKKLRELL